MKLIQKNSSFMKFLNFEYRYVSDCTVSDVTDAASSVQIIRNQCFAGVVATTKVSTKMQSSQSFK